MRVTPEMTTEAGGRLDEFADFLDVSDDGVRAVVVPRGLVKLVVNSTGYPSMSAWLDPDDAEGVGVLLIQRAAEARALQP